MNLSLNTGPLLKILDLESKKGYSDSAVIGGLDKFLHNWAPQAVESITIRELLKRFNKLNLASSDYASLTKEQRKEWVDSLLAFLVELEQQGEKKSEATPVTAVSQPSSKPRAKRVKTSQSIDSPITVIKGVSANLATKFSKMDVKTVRDLLYFFPNRHLDYSQKKSISELAEGKEETIVANVWQAQETRLGGRRSTEAIVGDETGNVRVVWFNNPYLARTLKTNARLVISGRVSLYKGRHVFESPEWKLKQ